MRPPMHSLQALPARTPAAPLVQHRLQRLGRRLPSGRPRGQHALRAEHHREDVAVVLLGGCGGSGRCRRDEDWGGGGQPTAGLLLQLHGWPLQDAPTRCGSCCSQPLASITGIGTQTRCAPEVEGQHGGGAQRQRGQHRGVGVGPQLAHLSREGGGSRAPGRQASHFEGWACTQAGCWSALQARACTPPGCEKVLRKDPAKAAQAPAHQGRHHADPLQRRVARLDGGLDDVAGCGQARSEAAVWVQGWARTRARAGSRGRVAAWRWLPLPGLLRRRGCPQRPATQLAHHTPPPTPEDAPNTICPASLTS